MGFFDGLVKDIKNQAVRTIKDEARYATRNAIQGAVDSGINKMKTRGQWKCICGCVNTGRFCMDCGKQPGEGTQCVNCGWQAIDKIPRFCPECGEDFDGDENT